MTAVRNFKRPYEIQLFHCRIPHLWSETCWKEAAAPWTSFKDSHTTWAQLKSLTTMDNRNQCAFCAVICHANNARVSHQEKTGVCSGAYFTGNTLFLIADYEDPTYGDWQILPVNHCLLLKMCPFFSVLIFICYIEYTFGCILLLSPLQ